MKIIDSKHYIENDQIFKTQDDTPIPENEPLFLFRGRDKLALLVLRYYKDLCIMEECTKRQLELVDENIKRFEDFANTSDTMKQPGITLI